MVPDPVKDESPVSSVKIDVINNNSESDEEIDDDHRHNHVGYVMLSTEPPANAESSDDEGTEVQSLDNPILETTSKLDTSIANDFDKGANEDSLAVWAKHLVSKVEPMTAEHAEKIKEAMKAIQLPVTAIPSWAQEENADDWMAFLLERIQNN